MDLFWSKVDKTNTCWLWLASKNHDGYGHFWFLGSSRQAHCVAWELTNGPVPSGLELDHTCRNRACVNPNHLEPVTHAENVRRGRAGAPQRDKTHCKAGHAYDEQNTYLRPSGGRACKTCRLQWKREYRARLSPARG